MRRRASAALLGAALIAGSGLAAAHGAEAQQAGDTLARPAAAAADSDFVVVQGRVVTADRRPPAGLRVFFRTHVRTDSADVQPDGSFIVLPSKPAADTVELFVDAADRERRWYFPSYVRLDAGELGEELRFVLVPRVWIPQTGTYAGRPIQIDLVEAFKPAADTSPSSFYARMRVRAGARWAPASITVSWPDSALPIPVVFVRDSAGLRISAADSSGFWAALAEMERDYGRKFFVPARYDELSPGDTARRSVITVRIDPGLAAMGWGGPGRIRSRSHYYEGNARFRSPSGLRNSFLVVHEMMHVLGFGHTCSWISILAAACSDQRLRAMRLGPHDVAHMQVYRRVHALEGQHRTRFGLLEALNGQRVLMLGLPPETGTIVVP